MQFAFNAPNFGAYYHPQVVAELAHEAEESGWDGFFLWDHMVWPWDDNIADPWISLTAIAMRTTRLKLGPIVTPLPRRRPWKVARETVTLDHLSNGRLILGAGIGDFAQEFEHLGEAPDHRTRAAMLDEGLDVLTKLWSAETFTFKGAYYTIHETRFTPRPVQQPRIPIWVAGTWPKRKPFERALRWDGYVPIKDGLGSFTPDDVQAITARITEQRADDAPFDLVISGSTSGTDPAADADHVRPFAQAGATWWSEGFLPWAASIDQVRERIRRGPPQV